MTYRDMPDDVIDALMDSQFLMGVTAGWNAAQADDPIAARQAIWEAGRGYLKPLRDWQKAGRPPAQEPVGYFQEPMPGKIEQIDDAYKGGPGVFPLYRQPPGPAAVVESHHPDGLAVGDRVRKVTGDYQISGEVRAVFAKADGVTRVVVEHRAEGGGSFLHIYAPEQMESE